MNIFTENMDILTEALFYIALILSCPFVYVVGKRFGGALTSYFLSRRRPMTVKFIRDGEVVSHQFNNDVAADEVVRYILNSTKKEQPKETVEKG